MPYALDSLSCASPYARRDVASSQGVLGDHFSGVELDLNLTWVAIHSCSSHLLTYACWVLVWLWQISQIWLMCNELTWVCWVHVQPQPISKWKRWDLSCVEVRRRITPISLLRTAGRTLFCPPLKSRLLLPAPFRQRIEKRFVSAKQDPSKLWNYAELLS